MLDTFVGCIVTYTEPPRDNPPKPAGVFPIFLGGESEFSIMLIVKGVKHSWGLYQGYQYDNFVLMCEQTEPVFESHYQDSNTQMLCGVSYEDVKIKAQDFKTVFNGILDSPDDFSALLGAAINPLYGKGSRVVKIELLDTPSRKGVY